MVMPIMREGISLLLLRWTALQMAVENEWGGRDSRMKADELADSILSWFVQSKGPLYIDDLENLIDDSMLVSFNTEIEDGSVEEVIDDDEDEDEDEDEDDCSEEEVAEMMVDDAEPKEMAMDHLKPSKPMLDEEGWSVVAPRRSKGRK